MSGNRVEELEAKVRTLEATVDGLTDELVETKERLQAIEEEVGVEPDVLDGRPTRSAAQEDLTEREETDGSADGEEPPADDVNPDEADEEDNADSESGDDIIVA